MRMKKIHKPMRKMTGTHVIRAVMGRDSRGSSSSMITPFDLIKSYMGG